MDDEPKYSDMTTDDTGAVQDSGEPDSESARQQMPFAFVEGLPVTELPRDLYIPPYALEVFLEAFEGPLDLLLYLIKKQNLDILNIPVAEITRQYMEYIELMKELRLELAAEYLVMAAMLAEIKSRMLLPRPETAEEEDDPRAELVRRLREYERFRQVAEALDQRPRLGRDVYEVRAATPLVRTGKVLPKVSIQELAIALQTVMARARMFSRHHVQREPLPVRERMSTILQTLKAGHFVEFTTLFQPREGRRGVVVTFLAMLELLREAMIEFVQAKPYGPIHVKALV